MHRTKFEETFDMPPKDDDEEAAENPYEGKSIDQITEEVTEIVKSLNTTEKIDYALTTVTGLSEHDIEMDEVAAEAMKSYQQLMEMGMNSTSAHAGRIFESANSMLRLALEAKDAKANRKLKVVDLQIKKAKLEESDAAQATGIGFDRNDLLKIIQDAHTIEESNDDDLSDSDK